MKEYLLKLKSFFDIEPKSINIGFGGIELSDEDSLEQCQLGFVIDDKGHKIEDWFGDNFIVVGFETGLGDPIYVEITKTDVKFYFMMHDDWSSSELIANSIDDFKTMYHLVAESDLSTEKNKQILFNKIKKIQPKKCLFWEYLVMEISQT